MFWISASPRSTFCSSSFRATIVVSCSFLFPNLFLFPCFFMLFFEFSFRGAMSVWAAALQMVPCDRLHTAHDTPCPFPHEATPVAPPANSWAPAPSTSCLVLFVLVSVWLFFLLKMYVSSLEITCSFHVCKKSQLNLSVWSWASSFPFYFCVYRWIFLFLSTAQASYYT